MKRNIYRKWYNPDEDSENFLLIYPNGLMLQISFEEDKYGTKSTVYLTTPANRLNPDVFVKHKDVCSADEFNRARRKANDLMWPDKKTRTK